jgi:hypothetical protein
MVELGFLIFGAFGIIAAIAESEPPPENKRLARKSQRRRNHM